MPRRAQPPGRFGQRIEGGGLRQLRDLFCDPAQHVGRQRLVALELLAFRLRADTAGKARHLAPHRVGILLADILVACKAKMLGKPGHGRGLDAGMSRLLAHGKQCNVARLVQDIARGGLELIRHRVECLDDRVCERAG